MSRTRIRDLGLLVGFMIVAGIASLNAVSTAKTDAAEAGKDSKLRALLTEKMTILQNVVNQLEDLRARKEVGADDLYAAHLELNRAKLELCHSNQERIAILETLLGEARRREEAAIQSSSRPLHRALERAQVDRLDVEIQLEQMRSK